MFDVLPRTISLLASTHPVRKECPVWRVRWSRPPPWRVSTWRSLERRQWRCQTNTRWTGRWKTTVVYRYWKHNPWFKNLLKIGHRAGSYKRLNDFRKPVPSLPTEVWDYCATTDIRSDGLVIANLGFNLTLVIYSLIQ